MNILVLYISTNNILLNFKTESSFYIFYKGKEIEGCRGREQYFELFDYFSECIVVVANNGFFGPQKLGNFSEKSPKLLVFYKKCEKWRK